jgi:DNA-binding LacI/PurR family transcriptional regulator
MRRCTLEDIAAEAGVSIMSASRAINGRPGVGSDLRRRVIDAAERLNYRPNRAARGLASNTTSTVGLILPDISNPYFSLLAKASTDVARAADKNVFILNTDEDPALEEEALASLAGEAIDGVLLAGSRLGPQALKRALEPFDSAVLINRAPQGTGADSILVDDAAGAADAMAYLARGGRTRIALISGPAASGSGKRRLAGYKAGLKAAGLDFEPLLVERCIPTLEGGAAAVRALLSRSRGIDAVLAYNDIVAIGAMRELLAAGFSVPEDIGVIGTDDVPYAALVRPSLTSLSADIPALGRSAMSRLLALIRGEPPGPCPLIRPRLVVRESA